MNSADFEISIEKCKEGVQWYNTEKFHRSLPDKSNPAKIYFETEPRIFRPLQASVNWNQWFNDVARRKVTKYNQISYKFLIVLNLLIFLTIPTSLSRFFLITTL